MPVPPRPDASDPLRARFIALPKTELHLHALGAMRPTTVVELARQKGASILPVAERAVVEGYAFRDLPEFVELFIGLFPLVVTPADFERVAFELLEDAAALGVRYIEVRWTPGSHVSRGATVDGMFTGLEAARAQAERHLGVIARWIVDFPRSLPVAVATEACDIAIATRDRGTVALDISGDERAVAADPAFVPVFRRARRAGLGIVAHAGEGAGPDSIVGALDLYGADRIGHGTRAVEAPALVARLAAGRVPLEVCPTSNECLGVVSSVAAHPVAHFVRAGVPVVLSSDDPTLFRTDLVHEYVRLHRETGLSLATLGRLAAHAFDYVFLPPDEREDLLADAQRDARTWADAAEIVG